MFPIPRCKLGVSLKQGRLGPVSGLRSMKKLFRFSLNYGMVRKEDLSMARSLKHERQLLSSDELTLVEKTHHPALGLLPEQDLAELRKRVRERRDRAQTIAARQRREMRGKAASKGVRAATNDSGTREKRDLLAAAVQRLNKEAARREAKAARQALIDNAKRAHELHQAAGTTAPRPSPGRTANEGIKPKNAPAYSLRNPAKLGAISQHNKNTQAKRDSR